MRSHESGAPPRNRAGALPADWRSLLFWPSTPLVLAQGLWVRLRASGATEAAGERSGLVGAGMPLNMLALGDSIIAGVGIERIEQALPGQFAGALAAAAQRSVQWRAIGRIGANCTELRLGLQALQSQLHDCDVVLLSIGVNDVTGLRRRRGFASDLRGVLAALARLAPKARVLLAAVPPLEYFPLLPSPLRHLLGMRAAQFDAVMRKVSAEHPQCLHVPMPFVPEPHRFGEDGFHPNARSCTDWAEWLVQHALQRWPLLAAEESRPASAVPG